MNRTGRPGHGADAHDVDDHDDLPRCGGGAYYPSVCLACQALARVANAVRLTGEEFDELCNQAGRNHGPALLIDAWFGRKIHPNVMRTRLGPIWSAHEFPDPAAQWSLWSVMFHRAGYTVDGKPAARPDTPRRLYRAAPASHRFGHSWSDTDDLETARGSCATAEETRIARNCGPPW